MQNFHYILTLCGIYRVFQKNGPPDLFWQ